jgi:prephenate dehydrogenase
MKDEDGFASLKIAVVGLGLMGGSLAIRLREQGQALLAVDPDPNGREFALRHKVVDRVSADPHEIIPDADVIILAAPVDAILDFIPSLPRFHHGSPLVVDLGSTKVQICQALSALPPRFEAVGGHPMCGKAVGGIENADPALFNGAAFVFASVNRTTPRAYRFAEWLAGLLGATPLWLDPDAHDRRVAATSHLPYLVSSALALATPAEAAALVGPGFRSSSRLAGSSPTVMLPILETNRANVLEAIACFRAQLDGLEAELRERRNARLGAVLEKAREHREWLAGWQK